jgi:hypothetical protein
MEPQLQLGILLKPDLVGDEQDIGLEKQDMPAVPLDAQLGCVGRRRIARPVVEFGCRTDLEDRRAGVVRQRLAALEPLRSLAHLPPAVDQERIVLPGPLRPIAVVADLSLVPAVGS